MQKRLQIFISKVTPEGDDRAFAAAEASRGASEGSDQAEGLFMEAGSVGDDWEDTTDAIVTYTYVILCVFSMFYKGVSGHCHCFCFVGCVQKS